MASDRLDRMKAVMQDYVDRQQVAGVVTILVRAAEGRVVRADRPDGRREERPDPQGHDLPHGVDEQGRDVCRGDDPRRGREDLRLSDPVSKFLPAFKQTSVAIPGAGSRVGMRAGEARDHHSRSAHAHRRDLLRQRPGRRPVEGGRHPGLVPADRKEPIVPLMERLAALPFDAQPGERYVYGYNTDILGAVIEKASGVPLDEFVRTRIFAPLKMTDSGFFLPPEKREPARDGLLDGPRRPHRPRTGARDRPGRLRGRAARLFRRRRRPAVDGERLRALPADAAERRRARRRPHPRARRPSS